MSGALFDREDFKKPLLMVLLFLCAMACSDLADSADSILLLLVLFPSWLRTDSPTAGQNTSSTSISIVAPAASCAE
jgi:hypothetical protein